MAVNMFCMISQLNPGIRSACLDTWAQFLMKSADGPLGGSVTPLHFPAIGFIIGVFVASSHSGYRQKDRKLVLVVSTDWSLSYLTEAKTDLTIPPEMTKNLIPNV